MYDAEGNFNLFTSNETSYDIITTSNPCKLELNDFGADSYKHDTTDYDNSFYAPIVERLSFEKFTEDIEERMD